MNLLINLLNLDGVRQGWTVPCLWVPMVCQLCLNNLISQRVGLTIYVLSMFYQWDCLWLSNLAEYPHHHWPYMVPGWWCILHPRYGMLLLCIIDGTSCILVPDWRWLHFHLVLVVQSWWTPVCPPYIRVWYNMLLLILFCASSSGIYISVVEWAVYIFLMAHNMS